MAVAVAAAAGSVIPGLKACLGLFGCCDRCADATERATYLSALKCQKCSLGNVLPVRPLDDTSHWQCDRCAYKLKADVHAKVLSKLKQEMEAIDSNDVEE